MRISIGKSKNKEFVYILRSYRNNNKSTTQIFKKLGSMDEFLPLFDNDRNKVVEWAREQARIATEQYNNDNEVLSIPFFPTQIIDKNSQRSFNCGYRTSKKMIQENGKPKKNRKNPSDPARFIKKTAVTANGEACEEEFCIVDQEMIDKEAMYDGFYTVTTNMDEDVAEIIAINKRRWQIEECFRIMKTEFQARPIYLQREDRIKAHFLICF